MRTLRAIVQQFPALKERGLTNEEAEQSLAQNGANRLTPLPREPIWKKFLEKFDEAIIKILLAATLLKTVVDLFEVPGVWGFLGLGLVLLVFVASAVFKLKEWLPSLMFGVAIVLVIISVAIGHPSYEGLAVMIAVLLATGVAFFSEYKSDREFEILNTQKDSLQSKAIRNGEVVSIPLEKVVVGDLIALEMGDEIPADGRVIKATELHIDQSLMTGESEAVRKYHGDDDDTSDGPDHASCVYRGTQVVDGVGQMVVTDVGDMTMIGQIARRLSLTDEHEGASEANTEEARVQKKLTISKEQTPLQEKLTDLAGLISKVGYAAALAIFLALLARGIFLTHEVRWEPTFVVDAAGEYIKEGGQFVTDVAKGQLETTGQALRASLSALLGYFVYMVIIVVVAVPEGLPMSVTVSLALAMRKMTRANSLVRQLVACETIGSATVICSDKTGTLTQNKMQVERLGVGGEVYSRDGQWPKATASLQSPVDWIGLNGSVNATANLEMKDGKHLVIGNTTEGSLLQWAREGALDYREVRNKYPLLYQLHFSSDRKRMTSVVGANDTGYVLVKGAPEIVLSHCTHQLALDGRTSEITPADRDRYLGQLKEAQSQAMRTLAFAHRTLPAGQSTEEDALNDNRDALEQGLIWDGFVAIRDPLRPDVKAAVDECRQAGIDVKMITGDNIETARAIGREIGLLDSPEAISMTSDEFNSLSDDEISERLPRLAILARARPLDKYRVVRLLQAQQHVVAVTGDGTNDAPALKKADVGLAMGIAGTEVAKEASKIVLLDDAFSTIVKAVHWGRSLYENIQRFIQFQLTINVSALVIAFLGPFFGIKPPFTVLQLLWINVIMDTFAAIALCSEPPRAGLMRMKPKKRNESIVTSRMRYTILTTAAFFVVVMLALLLAMERGWLAEGSGSNPDKWEFSPLNIRQVSIFFTVYVFFQVWNQINCRSLTSNVSGLRGVLKNRTFMTIMALIVIGQVLMVSFGGQVFSVEPLKWLDWLVIAAVTSSVILFAEIMRRVLPGPKA
jgi:Ca2+-transporting ATPase